MINLLDVANRLDQWVCDHKYKGYEPFDGLSSFLRPLTFNNLFLERILQQTVRQSPINLRPILGVKPQESTKGKGYMAWGYLKMFELTGHQKYKEKAAKCLDWLIENKAPKYSKHSWGNHFDYCSRGGKLPKFEPTIVWTGLIGQVFLDAYQIINDEKYLKIATSICSWIMDLPREYTDSGTCLSYVMPRISSIHNSNMIGAAMLARTAKFTCDKEYLKVAREAMKYSCSRQLQDGAWYYGESSNRRWIDNFHTGYNLDSLKRYIDSTEDKTFEEILSRGYRYYKNSFIESSGKPKYYHNRVYPIDIQCASQAIDTLSFFSENDESSLGLALKVAKWTIDNMQAETDYFYYRILPFKKIKIPMIHWGQATMYKALSILLLKKMK